MSRILVLAGLLGACKTTAPETPAPEPEPAPAPAPEPDPTPVVQLTTSDDVTLEADWYPSTTDGAPAFVLLHMIPPSNDRTNWPRSFVTQLQNEGWGVLVVDRRGAGGSEGVASEAYEGPNGRLDVDAAVQFVQDSGHGSTVLIGASNGTTSLLDYTVWAAAESKPLPVAVGLMTGGSYTENQNAMNTIPDGIPAVFTFSTAERDWSVAQQTIDPGSWSFLEYADGAHGTRMFDVVETVGDDLVAFFRPHLQAE